MKKALLIIFGFYLFLQLFSCRGNDTLPAPKPLVQTPGISNTITGTSNTVSGTNTVGGTNTNPTVTGGNTVNTTPGTVTTSTGGNTIEEATGLITYTYSNLPAAIGEAVQSTEGHYTLFSLRTNTIVLLSDSATTQWDIGFKSTTIIFNSGTSGPGNAGVIIQNGIFDEITTAPTSGYKQDNSKVLPPYGLPNGSSNGWYNYNDNSHVITPIPGRVLIVRTANNKYAKVEILSYYKDAPLNPTSDDESRYYKFRYSFQGDGSTTLK